MRYLVTLCETNSFSKTAELHYISTSSCSRKIRSLEDEMGCMLFVRDSHGVTPTPAGMEMRDVARRMISMIDHLDRSKLEMQDGTYGQISLALDALDSGKVIEPYLKHFLNEYPQIKLAFHSATITNIETGLLNHTYDAGILIRPKGYEYPHFDYVVLKTMAIRAYVHKDHPLAERGAVTLEELVDWEIVLFDRNRSPAIYDHIIKVLYNTISLTWIHTVDRVGLMQTMCAVNQCVGICFSAEMGADGERFKELQICGVSDEFEYVLAVKKGLRKAPVQQLCRMLAKRGKPLQI